MTQPAWPRRRGAVKVAARPHPAELLAAIPPEIVGHASLVGEVAGVRVRLAEYAAAGVDEVALVPGSCDEDPAGVATLATLAR